MKNKNNMIKITVLSIVLIIFFWPVKVTCGAPGYTCTPAPDQNGLIYRNYDIEPLGIMLLESLVTKDLPIKYFEGTSVEKYGNSL